MYVYLPKDIPAPPGIRKECLDSEHLFRRYGKVVSAYDPAQLIGGIYNLEQKQWIIFYPIEPEIFAERVAKAATITGDDVRHDDAVH